MKVPLTLNDFLDRAVTVYGDRVAVTDEPDQPAPSLGAVTFRQLDARAKAQAAGLDALGIGPGERVAVVSHNAARLLAGFWGVAATDTMPTIRPLGSCTVAVLARSVFLVSEAA